MTNKIDLSQLVGQKVVCEFVARRDFIGRVETHSDAVEFPYVIFGYYFNANGKGYSHEDIKSIHVIKEIPLLTGIAQKHPNINLNDFTDGDTVYVKCKSGKEQITKIYKCNDGYFSMQFYQKIHNNGFIPGYGYIEEIYGPGAYHTVTKEIPDEPIDPAVEKAKEVVKDLTEEQIAKLLHSLKK
jgi:hypothetical protein